MTLTECELMSETQPDERITKLQEQLAFQQHELSQLSDVVLQQHKTITGLQDEIKALKQALRRMAQQPDTEVIGAYGGDDPVPSSG